MRVVELSLNSFATLITIKERILLEIHYLPGDLERWIEAFVEHYNHVRYQSRNNLTPADVYFDRPSHLCGLCPFTDIPICW